MGRIPPHVAADHPRIRGEHLVSGESDGVGRGSSPHTRGALSASLSQARGARIIPAYAGSTSAPARARARIADHPRIRGEHQEGLVGVLGAAGSSPHTRGAPRTRVVCAGGSRIIPAYAGSTPAGAGLRPAPRDHPRIRGEHPPRDGAAGPVRGIIPAYAGSTPRAPKPSS